MARVVHRTSRSSAYEYERLTEVPEVPGAGMKVLQNFQKFRVLWHGRTEVTDVPGRYKNDVPVPRVFVVLYRTYRSSGYGHDLLQNLHKFFAG